MRSAENPQFQGGDALRGFFMKPSFEKRQGAFGSPHRVKPARSEKGGYEENTKRQHADREKKSLH